MQHLFKEYLEKGYYPFLLEGEGEYYTKIEQVVNYIIDSKYTFEIGGRSKDFSQIAGVNRTSIAIGIRL